jgi:TP901 family phage tail tape measure protein
MASRSIATKVSIEGEKQYKSAITSINTSLRTLKAEMTAVTAEFQTNANSEDALRAKLGVLNQTLDKQREKINTLKSAIESGKAAQNKYAESIQKIKEGLGKTNQELSKFDKTTQENGKTWLSYKTQLDAANQKLEALKKSTGDTSAEQAELKGNIADLESKMKDLETSTGGAAKTAGELLETQAQTQRTLATQEERLQGVTNKTEKWQAQLYTAKSSEADLKVEIDKTNGYLNEAVNSADHCATSIDKMGKEVKDAAQDMDDGAESVDNVGESFDTLSSILVTSGIVNGIKKVASALKECVDVSADFHYTMATVQAVSGATSEEIQKLETQAKDYASTTVFMAQDVANSYQVMGQAGWTVDEMLDSMKGTMSLASAASEDLGETTNIVVDAMTAFNYGADQAGHFADVLARASADTNTSVALLGNSFQACATTAGGMGYSIDDVAVALGIMANNGLKAEMSGTALTTAITRMSGANDTASAAMEDLGLTMFETSGQAKPLGQFLGELRGSFKGMTEEQKINNAYMLAGQRGMKGLLAIVNASDDDWNNLTESIANCSGAAEEMSNIQLDTYTGQVKLLQSATEGLEIAVGDQLTPALGSLAEAFTGVLNGLTQFVNNNSAAIPVITGVVAALATFTTGITVATTAVKIFQLVTSTLGGALNPVALALGGISVAAGLLVTTFAAADGSEEDFRQTHEKTMASIGDEQDEISALVARLGELTGKSTANASEQREISAIVDTLNGKIPDLSLSYDSLTNSVNLSTDAILAAARAMANQDKIEADYEMIGTLQEKLADAQDSLAESMANAVDAQSAYDKAFQEYNDHLHDAPGTVSEYRDALNDARDELEFWNEQVDRDTDTVSGYQEEINATADEIKELSDATVDTSESTEAFGDSAEETGEAVEVMTEEMQEANDALADLTAASMDARENGGDLRETYNELEKEFEKYKDEASESAVKTAELELATLNLKATNQELLEQYPGLVAGVESLGVPLESLSQWLNNNEITAEEWGKNVNSEVDGIVNGFKQLETDADISLQEMADNLAYNVQAYQSWDQNLETLMGQAVAANDQGAIDLVNTMRDLGIGYSAQVQAMVDDTSGLFWDMADDMTEAGESGMTGYYHATEASKKTAIIEGIADETAAALSDADTAAAGVENMENYADGQESGESTVETAAKSVADAGADAAAGENRKYKDAGTKAITQLKIGMLSQKSNVSVAASTIASAAAGKFSEVSWYSVGRNIASGVASGINSNSYLIKNAATSAAKTAYNSAKHTLGIHSPSRVMAEVGRYYDEGFAQGISENVKEVTKAASQMAMEGASGVYAKRVEAPAQSSTSDQGDSRIQGILERYLPAMLEELQSGSGITVKGLAKAISPYIDDDLGQTERRRRRGN